MWRFPAANATRKRQPSVAKIDWVSAAQYPLHRAADRRRGFGDRDAGALQRFHLVGGGSLAAGDDRAGMPHPPAGRRRRARDKPDRRLLAPGRFEKSRAVLLGMAADFADHDDRLGL